MIRGALIGSRFEHCTLANFEVTRFNEAAHAACLRVAAGDVEGVFLFGPVGVGKTHLLAGLARAYDEQRVPRTEDDQYIELPSIRELAEREAELPESSAPVLLDPEESAGEPVVEFWPMLDLVSELRAEIKAGELELSRRCRTCDLLVIDDLGGERASDFVKEEILRVIDWRYRDCRSIAVATNLTDREVTERYGWATLSRWTESCELVRVEGPDYREIKRSRTS